MIGKKNDQQLRLGPLLTDTDLIAIALILFRVVVSSCQTKTNFFRDVIGNYPPVLDIRTALGNKADGRSQFGVLTFENLSQVDHLKIWMLMHI